MRKEERVNQSGPSEAPGGAASIHPGRAGRAVGQGAVSGAVPAGAPGAVEARENLLVPGLMRWPADPARPVISLRGVVKRFGDRKVLDGLDLDIHTGLTTVIAGASGSGKSVLLKLMNGLVLPDEGQVLLFGEDTRAVGPARLLELRKRVTMMFQSYALLDSLTVEQNVAFPVSENTDMPWSQILERVRELLVMLELGHALKKTPAELSGGMRKRVSLARAVISNPEVVLFDEPTTGLDPVMIDLVDKLLIDTKRRFGITSVVISHDMTSASQLADRLAMLEGGRISVLGPVDEVVARKASPLVEVFFESIGRLESHGAATRSAKLLWEPERRGGEPEPPVVRLTGVEKSFGPHKVLHGVDLFVPERKITVLIGGSGSGKSVIMKHIIGLMRADKGRVEVFGQDLGALSAAQALKLRERFGMVFQGAALLDALSVRDNVAFPLRERGLKKAEVDARVDEVLEQLKLADIGRRMPDEISAGQRKRTGLARALATKPGLIIYDEPTTGQDPVLTRYLDDMIVEAQSLFDITSLVVSHDMPSAFRIAHQIAMLHEGRIVAAETPDGLKVVSDPLVRRFIYAGTEEGERAAREVEARGLARRPADF
jgi:ABC-type transporter Mla maintaining outer membrane lipid asymmetry ATPase subunit MlaF